MNHITAGTYNDAQLAALLTVYRMRNITVDELLGFRQALLATRVPVDLTAYRPIDIVGTGGDGKNTFNISTCACFIVAAAGYPVAKHGNYGATSISGASNAMEQHGVRFSNRQEDLQRSIEGCNMAYLHAPLFNPGLKAIGPVRKACRYAPSSTCWARWSIPASLPTSCSEWPTCSRCASTPILCSASASVSPS